MAETIKILTVLGARPQFIKAAAVSRVVKNYPNITEKIFHSGQHYDFNMSEIFFEQMGIPKPCYQKSISNKSQAGMIAEIVIGLEEILAQEHFDLVMVYGDTNTTFAGALVGKTSHIPLIHVEAGLRAFDNKMPEEINRVLTDHISDILFCPTASAKKNLLSEGICKGIHIVGDVMYDATLYYKNSAKKPSNIEPNLLVDFYLCTFHRQENTDNEINLRSIISALCEIANSKHVILPLHPRTRKAIQQAGISTQGLNIIDPVGYFEMLYLLQHCQGVITDSGGLQKEGYFFQKPIVILRNKTEWVELVESGAAILAGNNTEAIIESFRQMNRIKTGATELYGNGNASAKIVEIINKLN
jgi:UDP-GlcNAc3NAcA epimerase